MRAAWHIATRDLREYARDGRLRGGFVALGLLLAVAAWGGAIREGRAAAERADAQRAERDRWLMQGDVNPHAAAHYGTFVFAPREPLALVDPGVTPFVGAAVFLEAHQQQLARYRPVEDAGALRRLGALSVATALQTLLPLVVVLFASGAIARDRERGIWRLLLASGVTPAVLVSGRILGIGVIAAVGLAAATLVGGVAVALSPSAGVDADVLLRGALLAGTTAVHLSLWLMAGTAISLWAASLRQALVAGVACWLLSVIVAPVAIFAVAAARVPSPSATAFEVAIDEERAQRPSWDDRVAAATERFLTGEDLPPASNPEVVALIDTEAADTELYRRHLDALDRNLDMQSRSYRMWALVSPAAALQVVSMALAATDHDHHRHFLQAAASYRTAVLDALNSQLASFDAWKTFNAAGNRDAWARVPEFDYDTPAVGWALSRVSGTIAGLLAWLALAAVLLIVATKRHGHRP